MLGKRLINSNDAGGACTTNTNDYPTTNLAYYKMSSAADEKGAYNGTATDVNFNVAGKFGNAGSFNGTSSYISTGINVSTTLMTSRSYSFWFKQNSNTNNSRIFGGANAGVTNNGMFRIREDNGQINYYSINNGVYTWATTLTNNVWTHVALTDTGSLAKLYINGVEITSPSTSTYTTTTNTNLQIGRGRLNSGTIGNYTNGSIDQVRIFSSALDATQVTQLYNEVYCVPTIVPSENFNTVLYTGDGTSSNAITGVGFEPNLTWIKDRGAAAGHWVNDSVRGAGKGIMTQSTGAEITSLPELMSSFDSDGFTVGYISNNTTNFLNNSYVAWNWKAGGAAVSNTDGTITSQVSANTEAGFSIVGYTGNGVNPGATIGHGLNKNPDFIIAKSRSTGEWPSFHSALPISNTVYLNATYASSTYINRYSAINTETFTTGSSGAELNANGIPYIAYAFHSVDGFSKMGSYTGTGAAGNTIVTGFRPAFVMIKRTNGTSDWNMWDNRRGNQSILWANGGTQEATNSAYEIIFNSNAFTVNITANFANGSGDSYIFMAFAEEALPYVTRNATDPFGDSSELALYKFEDNANDAEGNYNGTASNVTYASGYIDKAAVFNGSSSAINTTYTPTVANLRTVSLWFKTNATAFGIMQSVGAYGVSSNYSWEWIYMLADGKIGAGYGANNGGAVYLKTTTASYNDNSWHYLTLILNGVYGAGSSVELYIDGVQVATTTDTAYSGSISTITGTFRLGHNINVGVPANIFNGSIDQVRIFNRALDDGEVTALYNE